MKHNPLPLRPLVADDVRMILRDHCVTAGSLRAAAVELGVSAAYLSQVITRKVEPGEKICRALGLKRSVTYIRRSTYTMEKP